MSDEPRPPREPRKWGTHVSVWRDLTGWLRDSDGKFSRLAFVVMPSLAVFLWHWPDPWTDPAVKAFAIIVGALVLNSLAERIPLADMLDALRAFSGSVAAKGLSGVLNAGQPPSVTVETGGSASSPPTTVTVSPGRGSEASPDPTVPAGGDAEPSGQLPTDGGVSE